MTGETWRIYWNEYTSGSYLYGSEITFHSKDDVEFQNELMPPGTVIKKWFSKTNYQMMRVEPSLPMIDGEGNYRISLNVTTKNPGDLILRIIYYDRYDKETESQIIRDGEGEFRCPLKAFSYEVQLVNAGATHFHFHTITISEEIDGEQKILSDPEKSKKRKGKGQRAER